MNQDRFLIVTADDFGIGPETSRCILELGAMGRVTATVALVNSPFIVEAVQAWHRANRPLSLGWHPCLTIDRPVSQPELVPSLVDSEGVFYPLGTFLRRLLLGRIRKVDVFREWRAQLSLACELFNGTPEIVNCHHHLHVFPMLGGILRELLANLRPAPFLRRVGESPSLMMRVPGAKRKRFVLSTLGRISGLAQARAGLPGAEFMLGINNPPAAADPLNFIRWLTQSPGRVVELMCHPGYYDSTIIGRDCTEVDGWPEQRVNEGKLLSHISFEKACRYAGFRLVGPRDLQGAPRAYSRRAA